MRILHIVPTYLPAVRYGGPIYSVHALARETARRGHQTEVFTTNVDGEGTSAVPVGVPISVEDVNVWYFPCSIGRRLYRSPAMGRALADRILGFDVLHLHSVFLWPTLAAARLAQKAAVPYVLSPRGMLVGDLIRRKSQWPKSAWINLFERKNIAAAAAIHVTSEVERTEFKKLGLRAQRLEVIANGIDLPDVEPGPAPRMEGRRIVLCLGRINWKKGLDRLIRAMVHVQDADLVIAGNDEENHRADLDQLVRELGLGGRVRFCDPVQGSEKWALIRSAAVFALASYSENFGIAVLEAMACSVPVVVTPEVGLASAVHASGAGIVVEGDAEKLGAAITRVLAEPALQQTMGFAGHKVAREQFAWDRIAKETEAMYQSILRRRHHAIVTDRAH